MFTYTCEDCWSSRNGICYPPVSRDWKMLAYVGQQPAEIVRKRLRYAEMANDAHQRGWKASVRPVEFGCWGFMATSTVKLLKELRIHCQTLSQTNREVAKYCSQWLWLRSKDPSWAPKWQRPIGLNSLWWAYLCRGRKMGPVSSAVGPGHLLVVATLYPSSAVGLQNGDLYLFLCFKDNLYLKRHVYLL